MIILSNIEKLRLTAEINDKVVDSSMLFDTKTKNAFKRLSKQIKEILLNEPKITSYGLNTLKNSLLTYWNESIKPDTEKFWTELKLNGIDFERKEPLKFALDKKRFRQVEQGIDARNHWIELKNQKEIQQRFSITEIQEIEDIISKDENSRIEILKKCLRKKEIPQSQYLKFGECMAYATNCRLWDKYFSQSEVEELYIIWKNFRSK
ncbi:hypothetical protein FPE01S_02_08410 [Flavihumibacter petaseus NBRC 106054]|uniref:Uncharacterized protein n=2 Tax=Flavihumibacter TaxID=1004301 RepID=A0A0E9N303_9BACT|nr:hypothetical protein FPE01S_02_08410 [Flavihumibacter petaseus NBRC 106054]